MAGLPDAPPIRVLIQRSRAFAVLPFVRPVLRWRRLPRTYGTGATASARWFALLRLTFALMVVLPTAVAALYAGLVASPLYLSEARVAIREGLSGNADSSFSDEGIKGAVSSALSGLSSILGGGAAFLSHAQAPFLLTNYVASLDYVARLDQEGWIRPFFTRPDIDPFQALRADANLEQLRRYWNRHVRASVDRRSDIVLLRVWAFTPEDARTIADRILKDGERLLNDVVVQTRADAVRRAREQLVSAQHRFAEALAHQQEWRVRQRAVDPVQAAQMLSESLLRLEHERIAADREVRALTRLSAPDGPTLVVLRDRLRALNSEIVSLKGTIAQSGSKTTAASALTSFEESELDVRFAEMLQSIAVAGLQEADRRARGQAAFVNVFVPPSMSTNPAPPGWFQTSLFVFVLSGIIWINAMILVAVIRDHRR
ncbi:hypothetical protein [Xanthobacter aminoxidans]|uniref:hypothetical protein n=1 Tax=Xanthobacter aminoxidans TaxID=186280 RepID=UPI002022CCE4|nr:hypothetical protein [Xanthobacter aminoxidans]MCL8382348.1 hypothetical protein [Xanthobacter aminoxidans]